MKALSRAISALVFFASAGATGALAQDSDDRELALRLYEEAAEDYREGQFDRAATKLQTAYDLFPEPVLLYNLGRALEGTGDLEGAQEAYEQFLEEAPADAEERPATQARLETVEGLLAAMERPEAEGEEPEAEPEPEPEAEPEEPPAPESEGRRSYAGPIALGSAALGAVVGGLVLQLRSASAHDEAGESGVSQVRVDELNGQAQGRAVGAAILFAVGGALAVGSTLWFVLGKPKGDVDVALGLGGVSVRGAF
ncbi:MAG: tetratricopeptide repeat protein [Myxococcota bacterium]